MNMTPDQAVDQEKYAGPGKRFLAGWIDLLAFLPLIILPYLFGSWSKAGYAAFMVINNAVYFVYLILMIGKYGQTLGKMAVGIKVLKSDGTSAGIGNAVRRAAVDALIALVSIVGVSLALASMPDSAFENKGYYKLGLEVSQSNPLGRVQMYLTNLWFLSEFVTMMFNNRRRAIHDFIGDTIVLEVGKGK